MNLIDVLIVGFVLLGALRGYQRGLIMSIVNFLSWIVGFLVASWQYMAVLRWSEQYLPLHQWLEPLIYRALLPSVESKAQTLQQQLLGNMLGILPEEWRSIFPSLNLSGVQIPQTVEQVTHQLAETITEGILSLIAFGFVFYCTVLMIHVIVAILLRPLGNWSKSFNRGGGLVFGGLSSLIGLAVLAGLLSPFLQMGDVGDLSVLILESYFYDNLVVIFNAMDQLLSAQLRERLLEPISMDKGVWY
ncbi:CvpA family protein [Desulfosporosinus sp.]|uniref:CvpA family protein n=1 Tax=Desulfosporosinus sp. TaxID=157907 RepID=UPI0025C54D07|nr:CvpA family protein [Desulfosporosinus sp.]MBC2722249.1 CvpA family protein [Desulfosporosinus sp.]MBC2727907.1 CvpA family protein [Desulfosporosinus sp.]